jgi:hypothetical protein
MRERLRSSKTSPDVLGRAAKARPRPGSPEAGSRTVPHKPLGRTLREDGTVSLPNAREGVEQYCCS